MKKRITAGLLPMLLLVTVLPTAMAAKLDGRIHMASTPERFTIDLI